MGLGFRVCSKLVGEIRIQMESSQHFSFWQEVEVSAPEPLSGPGPESFTTLYSSNDRRCQARPQGKAQGRDEGRRQEGGGLSTSGQCDITTPAGGSPRRRPCQSRCLSVADPSQVYSLRTPTSPPSNVKQDERRNLMVNTHSSLFKS